MCLSKVVTLRCVFIGRVTESICLSEETKIQKQGARNIFKYVRFLKICFREYVFRWMSLSEVVTLRFVVDGVVTEHICFTNETEAPASRTNLSM